MTNIVLIFEVVWEFWSTFIFSTPALPHKDKVSMKSFFYSILIFIGTLAFVQPQIQMTAVSCWWPVKAASLSRSLHLQFPTTFSWARCWSTCALSMRATLLAHACFSKVRRRKPWAAVTSILKVVCPFFQTLKRNPRMFCFVNLLVDSKMIFLSSLLTVIGQRLASMNLLSPLAVSDEFSTVRLQHNRAFTELLHAASSSLYPQVCMNVS